MPMDKDQAIRKAQKLMAVAMDGRGNDNEAERALAQAETLIRKFGIELSFPLFFVFQPIGIMPLIAAHAEC